MKHSILPLKLTLAAAGILAVLMTTGCWDDAEINGRAFVLGFGADTGGAPYSFSFQLAIPVSGESDASGSIEYTERTVPERTPAAAVRVLERDLGRQLNFEQLSLIVIGEELSREGFTGLTDYFFRRASVRRQSCIAVCQGRAEDFFRSSAADKAISIDAASALQSYDSGGGHIAMDLFSLYKTLINRDEFYLPKLSGKADRAASDTGKGGDKGFLKLTGASAYGRNGRYLGEIGEDELELLRLTCGSGTDGAIAVQDGSGRRYCCQVRQSDCSVKCRISDGLPEFRIKAELVIVPLDADGIDGSGASQDRTGHIAACAEQTVKEGLEALVLRSRETLGSSILGLQDVMRQREPDWYGLHEDEWEQIFPQSRITIAVSCTAVGGGITK